MTPKKLYQFLAVLFIFLLQTLALVGILQDKNYAQASYAISVIVRGQSGDNWLGIRKGINQAAIFTLTLLLLLFQKKTAC